jgi:predicted LPLAT superfamily acyltransferase
VHTKHAEKFNRLLSRYNPDSALNLLQVTDINAATAMLLAEKIEHGELVIIAADRTPVGGGRVAQVNFLGAPASLPQGPFVLAGLLKCPVYSLFCLKQGNKHRIIFEHFGDDLSWSRNSREQTIQQHAQRYAERLQHYCLQAPLQWFNFYDFWADESLREGWPRVSS